MKATIADATPAPPPPKIVTLEMTEDDARNLHALVGAVNGEADKSLRIDSLNYPRRFKTRDDGMKFFVRVYSALGQVLPRQ